MIQVKNLVKSFQNGEHRYYAVNDISFTIETGSFVVILGASGSGKTTLLNILSGLERPDSGNIKYSDIDITALSEKELVRFRRDHIGFVFQSYYLLPALHVEANIRMGANLSNNKDISSIIASLGLAGKEKKFPYELSGGEQQRVSIARAVSKNPHVLFCDEPTGALDERTGRQIMRYLLDFQKRNNVTMIMVTHNTNLAELADKVIHMNSGHITSMNEKSAPSSLDDIAW